MSMRKHSKLLAAGAALLIIAAAALVIPSAYAELRLRFALQDCASQETYSAQTNCIFQIIDSELHSGGVGAAMHVFSLAYESYPAFANGGCHTRAHKVGDMTYYEIYLGTESLDKIDFPQSTTACGYGFFHGFMEHLIQDHPDPAFVTETCNYFNGRLASRMHDIVAICYHGAGHGFTLAQTERLKKPDWGHIAAFVTKPAEQCSSLPGANAEDIEQCYEGIFNIMNEYMTTKQYGFTYDTNAPFAICATQPKFLQTACVYEMAQDTDSVAGENATQLVSIVQGLPPYLQQLAFGVGITGIIQQIVANGDGYGATFSECATLKESYLTTCVQSIVGGLFEEGDPQKEYVKPLAFCGTIAPETSAAVQKACYVRVAQELPRFYGTGMISSICPQFPSAYRPLCTEQVSHPSTANTPN